MIETWSAIQQASSHKCTIFAEVSLEFFPPLSRFVPPLHCLLFLKTSLDFRNTNASKHNWIEHILVSKMYGVNFKSLLNKLMEKA